MANYQELRTCFYQNVSGLTAINGRRLRTGEERERVTQETVRHPLIAEV
ncbi:MAG: hypothetical protein M1294_14145 [Firmicutes bacterium]|nr:hypothetical protein [Bacillota bacterium]MCL5013096.1 hypothetical protein [Bacillota bacterium]